MSVLTEALRLYAHGFCVVPCKAKKPVAKDWGEKRLSRADLHTQLAGTKLNIGIALNKSGFIDLECDIPAAEAALLAVFGGEVPPTSTWQSKRGLHRLFRRPPRLPEKAKVELDGVEFRIGNNKAALSI